MINFYSMDKNRIKILFFLLELPILKKQEAKIQNVINWHDLYMLFEKIIQKIIKLRSID